MHLCRSLSPRSLLVYAALATTTIIYGVWHLIARAVLSDGPPPLIFAVYRCAGGGLVLLVFLKASRWTFHQGDDNALAVDFRDVPYFILMGIFMAGMVSCCCLAGQVLHPLTIAVATPTVPVVTTLAAAVCGIEELSWQKVGSLVFSVAGAISIVLVDESNTAPGSHHAGAPLPLPLKPLDEPEDPRVLRRAQIFLGVGVVSMALYFVQHKALLKKYPPVICTVAAYLQASAILAIIALGCYGMDERSWSLRGRFNSWFGLAYTVFFTTALNYAIMGWANKETTPRIVTGFTTLQPIATALVEWYILGVRFSQAHFFGAIAIFSGLMLSIQANSEDELDSAKKPLLRRPTSERGY